MYMIITAFLQSGDFNVIIVDWSKIQSWHGLPVPYPSVVKKLNGVASYVASMIRFLEGYGMNLRTTTIIGHSLGAHVAGIASYNQINKIHHIVGMCE